jgi:enoyl-CoA hydratase/carnithine racemase
MQIGIRIPIPELALFRHKIPMNAFFETVQLARRWTGPDAQSVGIVQQIADTDSLLSQAQARAAELAPLATNRANYGGQKERIYGENSAIEGAHGAAYLLRNLDKYSQ